MKRKTLSAIIMTLFLGLVSCNSSATVAEESPQSRFLKSVISLGNDFLNLFTSFGDMVGGVLGFNTNTKKSDVGSYFKKVHDTVEGIKTALEKIVSDMRSEGNPNAEATDTAVKKLVSETLSKIIEGAKTASEAIGDASDPIGNVAATNAAGAAPKDATIAGGIALRVMSKDGKFAGPSAAADDAVTAVKGVAVSAVTKALDTLTIAIRNTIDLGLKEVKEAMKINVSDTPVTPDNITSEVKSK
nr:variable large family protein [Borrelia miyamotoi]